MSAQTIAAQASGERWSRRSWLDQSAMASGLCKRASSRKTWRACACTNRAAFARSDAASASAGATACGATRCCLSGAAAWLELIKKDGDENLQHGTTLQGVG